MIKAVIEVDFNRIVRHGTQVMTGRRRLPRDASVGDEYVIFDNDDEPPLVFTAVLAEMDDQAAFLTIGERIIK